MERHGVTMTMFCVRAIINTPIAPSRSTKENAPHPKSRYSPSLNQSLRLPRVKFDSASSSSTASISNNKPPISRPRVPN